MRNVFGTRVMQARSTKLLAALRWGGGGGGVLNQFVMNTRVTLKTSSWVMKMN